MLIDASYGVIKWVILRTPPRLKNVVINLGNDAKDF